MILLLGVGSEVLPVLSVSEEFLKVTELLTRTAKLVKTPTKRRKRKADNDKKNDGSDLEIGCFVLLWGRSGRVHWVFLPQKSAWAR